MLLMLVCMMVSSGCNLGIKTKNTLVIHDPVPFPETAQGAPVIATNRKIPLVIMNKPDLKFQKDIGGYVVVPPAFYDLLIQTYNKRNR